MKRMLFFTLFFCCLIMGCTKESEHVQQDERDKYTGIYEFEIENVTWWLTNDSIGWATHIDSLHTVGRIEKYQDHQLLIKYNNQDITGLWISPDGSCDAYAIGYIEDTLSLPLIFGESMFWGYYQNWTSPELVEGSLLKILCIPFDTNRGGYRLTFGGYFITSDSVYFGYSNGANGAGSFSEVYGRKIQ